jgi:hypothetical protein
LQIARVVSHLPLTIHFRAPWTQGTQCRHELGRARPD